MLKRYYKNMLFVCKSLFTLSFSTCRIQMLSILLTSSLANLNLFFRFGLFQYSLLTSKQKQKLRDKEKASTIKLQVVKNNKFATID